MEGILDHRMVTLSIPGNGIIKTERHRQMVPVFSRANDLDLIDALDASFPTFTSLYESCECCVDDMWLFFKTLRLSCSEQFGPFREIVSLRSNPWITREIAGMG